MKPALSLLVLWLLFFHHAHAANPESLRVPHAWAALPEASVYQGFIRALELGKRADANLPQYRVIVIMSDGQDDFPGGVTAQEVLDRLKEGQIPLYTLGVVPSPISEKQKDALKALGVLARIPVEKTDMACKFWGNCDARFRSNNR